MDIQLLELIFLSEKRRELLLLLREGPKTIAKINKFLSLNSVAVLPPLKKLRDNFMILKKGNIYSLSPLGIATVSRLQPVLDLLNVSGARYDYWTSHAIECILAPLLERIGELPSCTLSKPPDRAHLFELHREFVENFAKLKKLSAISSIFNPSFPDFFLPSARKGINFSVIVTAQVYERVKEEFGAELREFLNYESASFYVYGNKIEFSHVVTDRFLS